MAEKSKSQEGSKEKHIDWNLRIKLGAANLYDFENGGSEQGVVF